MKQSFKKSLVKKRGQSAIIAWVLLIGLSVSLAVIVSTWTKKQAEQTSETIVSQTEIDLRCASVSFNAAPTCEVPYDAIKIVNRGDFTIHKFVIQIQTKDSKLLSNTINLFENGREPIKPGETQTLRTKDSFKDSEIGLVPFIKVGEEIAGCSARKLTVKC